MKPIRDMTTTELRDLSDDEMKSRFHHDMQELLGMSDADYAEFRQVVWRRLGTGRHVHTRFCGHGGGT